MKILAFLTLLMLSFSSFAETYFPIKVQNFEIRGADALQHLEQLLLSPAEVLDIFEPEGSSISNRKVVGNQITFTATKKIAFISKSVFVKGTLGSEFSNEICQAGEVGLKATFDLAGSDGIVYDTIDGFIAEVCLKEVNKSFVKGRVSGLYTSYGYRCYKASVIVSQERHELPHRHFIVEKPSCRGFALSSSH